MQNALIQCNSVSACELAASLPVVLLLLLDSDSIVVLNIDIKKKHNFESLPNRTINRT
jgi:hypothetical protein